MFWKRIRIVLVLVLTLLLVWGIQPREIRISGQTMGTTYNIIAYRRFLFASVMRPKIETKLHHIVQSMSTYLPDSEISRFNRAQHTRPILISESFYQVLAHSKSIYSITKGAWDPTLFPVLQLWGFYENHKPNIPSDSEIQHTLSRTGFHYIRLLPDSQIQKLIPQITLDLSSIAKGYAVDQIATLLRHHNITAFFVDIGGEVVVGGPKPNGHAWRIGVQHPNLSESKPYQILTTTQRAIATSGTYQHYFEHNGVRYAHLIDPRSGYPISHSLVSATVIAPSCALADAIATAVMVLGVKDGLALLNDIPDIDGGLIEQRPDTTFQLVSTPGWKYY